LAVLAEGGGGGAQALGEAGGAHAVGFLGAGRENPSLKADLADGLGLGGGSDRFSWAFAGPSVLQLVRETSLLCWAFPSLLLSPE
jgi:hypothetical protein